MQRRSFVQSGLIGGGLVLLGGGGLFVRRTMACSALAGNMLDDALPEHVSTCNRLLRELPGRAREEMKRYFHGVCLNVGGFVSHICSKDFANTIARCTTAEKKRDCIQLAFCGRVAGAEEILNQVHTIASDIGNELDNEWVAYSQDLSLRWNTRIKEYGKSLDAVETTKQMSGLIRANLEHAVTLGVTAAEKPALGETVGKIGKSAILLMPVMKSGPTGLAIGLPLFFLLAACDVWDYAASQLEDRRGDTQKVISSKIANLGSQVGSKFEQEIRFRINELQTWQEQSIRMTASRLADEKVGIL